MAVIIKLNGMTMEILCLRVCVSVPIFLFSSLFIRSFIYSLPSPHSWVNVRTCWVSCDVILCHGNVIRYFFLFQTICTVEVETMAQSWNCIWFSKWHLQMKSEYFFFQCLRPINQNKGIRIFLLCNLFFMTSHLFFSFHRSWWQTPNSDVIFSSRKYKIKRDSKCHFKLLFLARSVLKFVFLFSLQQTFF